MRNLSPKNVALALGLLGVLGTPVAASAQTAADIATQAWPLGSPTSAGVAPAQAPDAGAGSARDIARQVWPSGAPASSSVSNWQPIDGGKLSGHYLARLRGGSPALLPAGSAAYSVARK